MGDFSLGFTHRKPTHLRRHCSIVEEIEGLIRVDRDGHVERFAIIPEVPCTWSPETGVVSHDFFVDPAACLPVRLYVPPARPGTGKLPLLVYFHGGGFCVASTAWRCYHEFLSALAAKAGCVIASVNYRLAPEHRLPAAYDDGAKAVRWVTQQAGRGGDETTRWWSSRCDFSRLFLGGDSAGGTIAYNVALRVPSGALAGLILIQPFFGGEARTSSEKNLAQPSNSALTLAVSDAYWRLALPEGTSRDHHWCNPANGGRRLEAGAKHLPRIMVCIAELDILRDREVQFCRAIGAAGRSVQMFVHGGVGHAFHVLHGSRLAERRRQELVEQIKSFVASRR